MNDLLKYFINTTVGKSDDDLIGIFNEYPTISRYCDLSPEIVKIIVSQSPYTVIEQIWSKVDTPELIDIAIQRFTVEKVVPYIFHNKVLSKELERVYAKKYYTCSHSKYIINEFTLEEFGFDDFVQYIESGGQIFYMSSLYNSIIEYIVDNIDHNFNLVDYILNLILTNDVKNGDSFLCHILISNSNVNTKYKDIVLSTVDTVDDCNRDAFNKFNKVLSDIYLNRFDIDDCKYIKLHLARCGIFDDLYYDVHFLIANAGKIRRNIKYADLSTLDINKEDKKNLISIYKRYGCKYSDFNSQVSYLSWIMS